MPVRKHPSRHTRENGGVGAQAYELARREQLSALQRARMVSAMFDVSCERGAGSVSVAHVVDRSGVSRRTFYEQFGDREECSLAAFEQALAYASERVLPAYEAEKAWKERIRAGLAALLVFLDEQPLIGRFLICESVAGGPRALQRRTQVVQALARVVREESGKVGDTSAQSALKAEGVIGGVLAVIQSRLTEASDRGHKDAQSMVALTNPLMSMIVLPYLGSAAARRELTRQVILPESAAGDAALLPDPFKEAGMRLTYRTVRVLLAVADQVEASNRQIGDSAGISDQGQISKLLARLKRIGLIEKTGAYPGKGAPNSWALTEKGRELTDGIRAHSEGGRLHTTGLR